MAGVFTSKKGAGVACGQCKQRSGVSLAVVGTGVCSHLQVFVHLLRGQKNIQVLAGEFVYRGDEPYCFDCVRRECAHCHKPISTTNVVIEIGGGDLVHERCFKCAECATTLVGKECFQNAEDAFLCESCNVAYIANSVGDPTQSVVRDCLSVLVGLSACVCL